MGLFTPIWKTKDVQKMDQAIAAVDKIDDPQKLKKVALTSVFPPVVRAAIERIGDQNILAEIIGQTQEEKTALAALSGIDDQKILFDVYSRKAGSKFYGFNEKVVARIRDQEYLKRIFAGTDRSEIYNKVYDRLRSPTLDETIKAGTGKAIADLVEAVKQMEYPKDRDTIISILKMEKGTDCFSAALDKLPLDKEAELIREIARSASNQNVYCLVKKLRYPQDKDILLQLLKDNTRKNLMIKQTIVKKIPSDDPIMGKSVCPGCGALDSVYYERRYDQSADLFTAGYYCRVCSKKDVTYIAYEAEPKDFSVPLREFIK